MSQMRRPTVLRGSQGKFPRRPYAAVRQTWERSRRAVVHRTVTGAGGGTSALLLRNCARVSCSLHRVQPRACEIRWRLRPIAQGPPLCARTKINKTKKGWLAKRGRRVTEFMAAIGDERCPGGRLPTSQGCRPSNRGPWPKLHGGRMAASLLADKPATYGQPNSLG